MIALEQAVAVGWQNRTEFVLAFGQRCVSEVLPILPEKIESDESRLSSPEQKIPELRFPIFI